MSVALILAMSEEASDPADGGLSAYAGDQSFIVSVTGQGAVHTDNVGAAGPSVRVTESELCQAEGTAATAACLAGGVVDAVAQCETPEDATIAPTDIQVLLPTGEWSAPEINSLMSCNDPSVVVFTAADFRALALLPSAIVVGPPGGWLPVNMVNVVYTDATSQVIDTALLGQPVRVRATPVSFTWEWADGTSPLTTSDPGAPHPNHTVSHTYAKTGTYTVTMSTQWSGEYSLDGGATYTPIDGTANTTSTAPPVTVTELRSRLVEDTVG